MYDPKAESEDESLPQDQSSGGSDTFFVPPEAVNGSECGTGDVLKFEVVGRDSDGNYEVKALGKDSTGGGADDFAEDLRSTFAKGGRS